MSEGRSRTKRKCRIIKLRKKQKWMVTQVKYQREIKQDTDRCEFFVFVNQELLVTLQSVGRSNAED